MLNLKIIKNQKYFLGFSLILTIISIISIFAVKLNLGVDFKGGDLFQIKYEKTMDKALVDKTLTDLVSEVPKLRGQRIQFSEDNTVIVKTEQLTNTEKTKVLDTLKEKTGKYDLVKYDTVGATIGKELTSNAVSALIIGSILIVIYITVRFEWIYAIAGILALLHDIVITIGLIALLRYEADTPFIAAILTILGYSINDTIVIFDRIRENDKENKKSKHQKSFAEVIDHSINQVFARSLYTSLTTLFSVIVLLIFGGSTLKTFSMTLFIGITFGTYSSIFIASPIVYLLRRFKKEDKNKDSNKRKTGKSVNGYDESDKVLV